MEERALSLLVVAGDYSADRHVSKVISKLKETAPDLKIWGVGGHEMQKQGVELLFNCSQFGIFGITAILKHVPFLLRVERKVLEAAALRKPQAVLLADFGGMNISIAKALKRTAPELKLLYFISPQVWGSRPWRINEIAKTNTKMLVIFPFEEKLYRDKGVPVRFVGHPLAQLQPAAQFTKDTFCRQLKLDPQRPLVAIFPGSRKGEILNLLPVWSEAIEWLHQARPDIQFAISQASEKLGETIKTLLKAREDRDSSRPTVVFVEQEQNHDLLNGADLVWAKSGTTSLEVTLFGKPMLVYYKADWLSYLLFLAFKRVRRVSWPNLLHGGDLVPELIQLDCRAEQLVKYTCDLLDVPKLREEISASLLTLRDQLGEGDFATACSEEILNVLNLRDLAIKT